MIGPLPHTWMHEKTRENGEQEKCIDTKKSHNRFLFCGAKINATMAGEPYINIMK